MYIKWFKNYQGNEWNLKQTKTEPKNKTTEGLSTLLALYVWLVNRRLASHPNSSKCQPYGVTAALFGPALRNTHYCIVGLMDRQEICGSIRALSKSDPCNFIYLSLYLNLKRALCATSLAPSSEVSDAVGFSLFIPLVQSIKGIKRGVYGLFHYTESLERLKQWATKRLIENWRLPNVLLSFSLQDSGVWKLMKNASCEELM